jgi:hypothetical protein
MKYELKSIGVWAFVKIAFVINFFAGVAAGLVGSLFFVPLLAFFLTSMEEMGQPDPDLLFPESGGFAALIFYLPLLYGFLGAVVGTLFQTFVVLAYNLLVKVVGGFELVLEPVVTTVTPATPQVVAATPTTQPVPPPPPPPAPSGPTPTPPDPQPEPPKTVIDEPPPLRPDIDPPSPDRTEP